MVIPRNHLVRAKVCVSKLVHIYLGHSVSKIFFLHRPFSVFLADYCLVSFFLSWLVCCAFIVASMEAPSKAFLLFFLLPDWLKLNHLKSRMECGFSDIFSRHFCSTGAETIGLTNYATSFGAKKMFRKPHLKLLR